MKSEGAVILMNLNADRSLLEKGGGVLIAACVALIYWNSLGGGFHYDDFHSIVWNPYIRHLGNLPAFFADPQTFSADPEKAMFRPVLLVSYALNYAVGEYSSQGYHLVNVVLHLLCALLVRAVGRRAGCGESGSLLAGLLFALHPLAGEPANYVSSRSESLAACFYLASVALFISGRKGERWISLVCFAAGLLTKSTVVTLPLVLLLHGWWRERTRFQLKPHLPFWGVSAAYMALIAGNRFLGRSLEGAPRGLWEQLWTQCKGLVYYLKLALVPVGLNVEHQFFAAQSPWNGAVLLSAVLLLSLALLAWVALPQRQLFWLAWAAVALLPSTLIPLNVLVNEHRLYLPLAGLSLLAGESWKRWERLPRWRLVGLVLLGIWGALVWQRNPIWRDEMSLWADASSRSPAMPRAHTHLGNALRDAGRLREAREAYSAALRLDSGHRAARTNLANLYYEMGRQDPQRSGQFLERAAREYEQVLVGDPNYREALNNLGSVYLVLGEWARARDMYGRVAARYPNFAEAHFNLGLVATRRGKHQEAVGHFERAIELQKDAEFFFEMGNAQVGAGELSRAVEAYRQAVRLEPGDTRYLYNLAEVLLVLGERQMQAGKTGEGMEIWKEAHPYLQQIVRQAPGHGRAAERLRQLEERIR